MVLPLLSPNPAARMVPLQQIKKIIVHDAIIESVMEYIKANNLALGDRIPSERFLAEALKVSRGSVREALKALESSGVLEIRHGGGTYLRSLSSAVYYQYTSDHRENLEMLQSLVQVRQAIEEWTMAEAARFITPAQIKSLYELEKKQPETAQPNMDLEIAVTRLFGNAVLLEMHEKIEQLWKQGYTRLGMAAFSPKVRHEHHLAIIKGLESGDAVEARAAIGLHNRSLEKYIAAAIAKLGTAKE